jgi:Ca-activated chloride channel homolog
MRHNRTYCTFLSGLAVLVACQAPPREPVRSQAAAAKALASNAAQSLRIPPAVPPPAAVPCLPLAAPPAPPRARPLGAQPVAVPAFAGGVEGGVLGGVPGGLGGGLAGGVGEEAPLLVNTPTGRLPKDLVRPARADELLVVESDRTAPRWAGDTAAASGHPAAALQARRTSGEVVGEFPLTHTEVAADIAGFMARTVVTQEYANPFREPIEAVYVFPLGAMAAVNDFVMEVGSRRIVGLVRPRDEAERIYQEARERGQTASLLTQERPNVFTQSVANIAPGGTVKITITTFETLVEERGTFEYVFPMVVGPRYIPGGAVAAPSPSVGGGGSSPATTVVPDADRITPPVLKPGERSGHDIGLTVHLDAGLPITAVHSVAHVVKIAEDGASRRTVKLTEADSILNRDFVLRWTVSPDRVEVGALTYRDQGEGYLALLVQPPPVPADALVTAREITFVLDVSGSMQGVPIETSKALVRRALDGLRPADAFNIVVFANGNGRLWPEAHDSSPENVAAAKSYLANLSGGGGTEMLAGLKGAITGSHDPARLQMYVFCTDGYVGDEERILAFVKRERGDARFFAFGIGSSVNRYLIDGIGRVGGGRAMVVLPRDAGAAERAADRFFERIDAPVLVDAAIDWNGLPVADVYPETLGDLFTGSAFNVVARFTRSASGKAYLTGRLGTSAVRIPIRLELPERSVEHPELAPVWARYKIADLSEAMLTADQARATEIKTAITDLAMEFRLASQLTSFVAVDESEVHGDGRPKRVEEPLPMPQDVKYEGVFGPPR